MDNGILAAVVVVAVAACVATAALMVARQKDAGRAATIEQALAAVARAINDVLGDAEVRALASWAYDRFGVSQYYSREEWVALCLRVVRGAEETLPEAARVV